MKSVIRNQKDVKQEKRPNHREVYGKQLTVDAENGRLSATLITIKPEGEILPHTHEVLEVIYIIEGEASVLANGARQKAEAGTVLVAPAGNEHGILNIGDKDVVLYCVFSPAIA